MKEYREVIPKERLLTKENATSELVGFVIRLFKYLGYDMEITYKDNREDGTRTIRARWDDLGKSRQIESRPE